MHQPIRWTLCGAIVLGCLTAAVEAQQAIPRPKFGTWNPPVTSSGHYGILGEVAHPGVYTAVGREVTLQELVQQAGGFSPQAGPAVRLIRQQRVAQGKLFDPNGRDVLQPGDVILIDSRRPAPMPAAVTHLAILGVAEHPVIVPVRPENAQLQTMMLALGQSPELARSVRLIMPPRMPLPASATSPLPSGTVLILDPRLLVATNLPSFPEPTPMALTPTASPPAMAPVTEPSIPAPTAAGITGSTQTAELIPDNRLPVTTMGRNGNQLEATPLPFTNGSLRPQVNETSLPVPGSRLEPAPVEIVKPAQKPKATVPLVNADAEIVPALDELGIEDEEPAATSGTTPGFGMWQMLGVIGTVASLVGVAVLSRSMIGGTATKSTRSAIDENLIPASIRKRSALPSIEPRRPHLRFDLPEPTPTAPTPQTIAKTAPPPQSKAAPAQETQDLQELLAMRGGIETEAVVLPHGLKLRRAAYTPAPIYRADEPAQLPAAPHERPITPTTPQRSLDPMVHEQVRAPHFLAKPAPAAQKSDPVIAEPLEGGTAIERALNHLQRGALS